MRIHSSHKNGILIKLQVQLHDYIHVPIYNRKIDRKKNGPANKLMLQAYA